MKIPFKTQPKGFNKVTVGNSEVGEIELPKYGDLTPNERILIAQAKIPDVRSEAVKLARTIATKSGKSLLETYNALVQNDSQSLSEYLEEFLQFQELIDEISRKRDYALATAILRYRLNSKADAGQVESILNVLEIILNDCLGDKADRVFSEIKNRMESELEIWTEKDTVDPNIIPPGLVKEIANFARQEENGWVEASDEEPPKELTEDDLGNLNTPENLTGEKSTGESEATGQETSDSVAEDSAASQPG